MKILLFTHTLRSLRGKTTIFQIIFPFFSFFRLNFTDSVHFLLWSLEKSWKYPEMLSRLPYNLDKLHRFAFELLSLLPQYRATFELQFVFMFFHLHFYPASYGNVWGSDVLVEFPAGISRKQKKKYKRSRISRGQSRLNKNLTTTTSWLTTFVKSPSKLYLLVVGGW